MLFNMHSMKARGHNIYELLVEVHVYIITKSVSYDTLFSLDCVYVVDFSSTNPKIGWKMRHG